MVAIFIVGVRTMRQRQGVKMRVFRDGQLVFSGQPVSLDIGNLTDFRQLPVTGALELGAQMVPGEYVLQVIATDLLAKEKRRLATQWIDFEVVK